MGSTTTSTAGAPQQGRAAAAGEARIAAAVEAAYILDAVRR